MNEKSLKLSPVGTVFKFTCRSESVKNLNLKTNSYAKLGTFTTFGLAVKW